MNKIFENLSVGEYLLKAEIKALSDTEITLYGNNRHFLIKEMAAKKGDVITREFAIALRLADFQKQSNYCPDSLNLTLEGDCIGKFELVEKSFPTVYTIGDSTVCNQENSDGSSMEHCGGWGQALPTFLGTKYAVSNHAEQGTHTRNCLDCHFSKVEAQLKEGDVVLCQFGHNDQKQTWLNAHEGYMENLIVLGKRVRAKGAKFILCTPINRLIYVNGKLNNYLDDYRDAVIEASAILKTQCIDLHSFTSRLYLEMGADAENLFYHAPQLDRTHPNDYGALKIASFVSENL